MTVDAGVRQPAADRRQLTLACDNVSHHDVIMALFPGKVQRKRYNALRISDFFCLIFNFQLSTLN
jgi:hypothetical protein